MILFACPLVLTRIYHSSTVIFAQGTKSKKNGRRLFPLVAPLKKCRALGLGVVVGGLVVEELMGRSFGRLGITSEKRDRRGGGEPFQQLGTFSMWQIMMTKQIDSGVGLNIYED